MTSDPDAGGAPPHPRAPCSRVVSLLADYLEERLPPSTHGELAAHLERCQNCLAQLQTYRSTVSLLRTLREDDLPSDLRRTLGEFLDRNRA